MKPHFCWVCCWMVDHSSRNLTVKAGSLFGNLAWLHCSYQDFNVFFFFLRWVLALRLYFQREVWSTVPLPLECRQSLALPAKTKSGAGMSGLFSQRKIWMDRWKNLNIGYMTMLTASTVWTLQDVWQCTKSPDKVTVSFITQSVTPTNGRSYWVTKNWAGLASHPSHFTFSHALK